MHVLTSLFLYCLFSFIDALLLLLWSQCNSRTLKVQILYVQVNRLYCSKSTNNQVISHCTCIEGLKTKCNYVYILGIVNESIGNFSFMVFFQSNLKSLCSVLSIFIHLQPKSWNRQIYYNYLYFVSDLPHNNQCSEADATGGECGVCKYTTKTN